MFAACCRSASLVAVEKPCKSSLRFAQGLGRPRGKEALQLGATMMDFRARTSARWHMEDMHPAGGFGCGLLLDDTFCFNTSRPIRDLPDGLRDATRLPRNPPCLLSLRPRNLVGKRCHRDQRKIPHAHRPPWPNGQGVGLLIRRLRVRVPQGVS